MGIKIQRSIAPQRKQSAGPYERIKKRHQQNTTKSGGNLKLNSTNKTFLKSLGIKIKNLKEKKLKENV